MHENEPDMPKEMRTRALSSSVKAVDDAVRGVTFTGLHEGGGTYRFHVGRHTEAWNGASLFIGGKETRMRTVDVRLPGGYSARLATCTAHAADILSAMPPGEAAAAAAAHHSLVRHLSEEAAAELENTNQHLPRCAHAL